MRAVDLDGPRTALRGVERADLTDLSRIRSTPQVARWWQARSVEQLAGEEDEAARDGEPHWTVWLDGDRVGFIQAYEKPDPEYRHAGIDLYLDPAWHGRHLGREITERVARYLFDDVGHHRVIIDPALANEPAIRCYEAVGFRRVGVMRRCWFDHFEGRWADGLLMDLLADDLRQVE